MGAAVGVSKGESKKQHLSRISRGTKNKNSVLNVVKPGGLGEFSKHFAIMENRAKVTTRAKQGARQKSVRAILHLSPRVRIMFKADHPAAALLSCAGWLELHAETIVN